jgi:hypothetical protein
LKTQEHRNLGFFHLGDAALPRLSRFRKDRPLNERMVNEVQPIPRPPVKKNGQF